VCFQSSFAVEFGFEVFSGCLSDIEVVKHRFQDLPLSEHLHVSNAISLSIALASIVDCKLAPTVKQFRHRAGSMGGRSELADHYSFLSLNTLHTPTQKHLLLHRTRACHFSPADSECVLAPKQQAKSAHMFGVSATYLVSDTSFSDFV
jgi:hypothetical protein